MGTKRGSYEYDVCFSFAGEQRPYVREVADGLTKLGVKVFYDTDETAELWGKDLYEHLDHIYREASRFCIIFVSKEYRKKIWTNHERKSAQARAIREVSEYILPARFDDTKIPGLLETMGFIDLRSTAPDELTRHILKKLGQPINNAPVLRSKSPSPPKSKFKAWGFRTGDPTWGYILGSPAVTDESVYVASRDHHVYALDSATGRLRWGKRLPVQISPPVTLGNTVYISLSPARSKPGGLFGLSTSNGVVVWTHETNVLTETSPEVAGKALYVAGSDGQVFAIGAGAKRHRWNRQVGNEFSSPPKVVGRALYVGSEEGIIYARETSKGEELWRYKTNGTIRSPLAVADGVVIAISRSDGIYAIDTQSGVLRWRIKSLGTFCSATIHDGVCYIANDREYVHALNLSDGESRWLYPVHGGVGPLNSPTVSNGMLYVGTMAGYIYALRLEDGGWEWSRKARSRIHSKVTVANGMIYLCSSDGVYAINAETGMGGLRQTS
ncbi:outer membrane protein assembly factor BamB family protein [Streptomyces chartreusis]|uniref:outer membrane protein assembly factor BamB family protein n=1 Tax=Streptomyces chartreusis TaxID=1969 RepID=UPI0036569554